MQLSEFRIGAKFTCDGARWRCTDVGTRVVAGIRVDEVTIATTAEDGSVKTRAISGAEAEALAWFNGPPYGVYERLFDEDDQEICEPA